MTPDDIKKKNEALINSMGVPKEHYTVPYPKDVLDANGMTPGQLDNALEQLIDLRYLDNLSDSEKQQLLMTMSTAGPSEAPQMGDDQSVMGAAISNMGSAQRRQADELMKLLANGVISKQEIAERIGMCNEYKDYEARRKRQEARVASRMKHAHRRRRLSKLADWELQAFYKHLKDKGSNGYFRRSDVAKVLKISPKIAGDWLRAAAQHDSQIKPMSTSGGYWFFPIEDWEPSKRVQNQNKFGANSAMQGAANAMVGTPVSPNNRVYNVFGKVKKT
jgi:hypothetical protein